MAAWKDSIDITTEIAFADNPLATSPTFTDVSTYVRGIPRIFHGKTSEEASIGPSAMTIVLSNRDRRFDPDYTSGPYFGNLVPMRRIRVTVALGAFSAVVFTGFVLGWQQDWQNRADGTVQLNARSGFQLLANETLPASAYGAEVLADEPSNYWPLQGGDLSNAVDGGSSLVRRGDVSASVEDIGFPLGESDVVTNPDGDTFSLEAPASVLDGSLPEAVEMWVSGAGSLLVEISVDSTHFIQFEFGVGNGLNFLYRHGGDDLMWTDGNVGAPFVAVDSGVHHVVMIRDGTDITFMADGSEWVTTALDSPSSGTESTAEVKIIGGGGISHLALYDTAPTVARFHAHYAAGVWAYSGAHGIYGRELSGARLDRILDDAGWPSADRDIDPGQSATGPYLPASRDPLTAMREVELAECGLLYFDTEGRIAFRDRHYFWTEADTGVIFSDDGAASAVKYVDFTPDGNSVETIRNIVTTQYGQDAKAATRRDTASVTEYGAADQTDACPTITDRHEALNRSSYILREKKDPQTRITRLVAHLRYPSSTRTTTQVENILDLQLGQVVTVEVTPMGLGSQVVKKAQVLGIEHEVTMGHQRQWTTTLYLSPAPTAADEAPYLTLGDATYGRIGAAAGNLIPY